MFLLFTFCRHFSTALNYKINLLFTFYELFLFPFLFRELFLIVDNLFMSNPSAMFELLIVVYFKPQAQCTNCTLSCLSLSPNIFSGLFYLGFKMKSKWRELIPHIALIFQAISSSTADVTTPVEWMMGDVKDRLSYPLVAWFVLSWHTVCPVTTHKLVNSFSLASPSPLSPSLTCPATPLPLTVSNVPDRLNILQCLSRSCTVSWPRFSILMQ